MISIPIEYGQASIGGNYSVKITGVNCVTFPSINMDGLDMLKMLKLQIVRVNPLWMHRS